MMLQATLALGSCINKEGRPSSQNCQVWRERSQQQIQKVLLCKCEQHRGHQKAGARVSGKLSLSLGFMSERTEFSSSQPLMAVCP